MVKKTAPVESPVTRIRPAKNQLELARFLDRTGQNGDTSEGTYRHGKPTGMMGRDRAPRPSRFAQLIESLQGDELLVRCFVAAW